MINKNSVYNYYSVPAYAFNTAVNIVADRKVIIFQLVKCTREIKYNVIIGFRFRLRTTLHQT